MICYYNPILINFGHYFKFGKMMKETIIYRVSAKDVPKNGELAEDVTVIKKSIYALLTSDTSLVSYTFYFSRFKFL